MNSFLASLNFTIIQFVLSLLFLVLCCIFTELTQFLVVFVQRTTVTTTESIENWTNWYYFRSQTTTINNSRSQQFRLWCILFTFSRGTFKRTNQLSWICYCDDIFLLFEMFSNGESRLTLNIDSRFASIFMETFKRKETLLKYPFEVLIEWWFWFPLPQIQSSFDCFFISFLKWLLSF
jgi:hypothetical protein